MKRILFSMLAMLVVFVLVTPAHATLITRGTGTSAHGTFNLIYDDDLDITWYDFSNPYGTWDAQVAWAESLSVDFGGDVFNDWRLPSALNQDGSGPFPGFHDPPTTVITSEMSHLYYTELLNSAFSPGNTGDFLNIYTWTMYWTVPDKPDEITEPYAWRFQFFDGSQSYAPTRFKLHALAVRDGDVIPEPSTIILMGIGLAGLAGGAVRRRLRKNKL